MAQWMVYGAYGYTGRLIVARAVEMGHRPVVAGRDPVKTRVLATDYGLEARVFGLSDLEEVIANLKDVSLVLHCAGPFSATHVPMFEACLHAKVHYLDITGEIAVFENVLRVRRDDVRSAGIVAIPGVGFDVVPTDCLAAMLKRALPDANCLQLGFSAQGRLSPGTSKTAVEGIAQGGAVRKNGEIVRVPAAYRSRRIRFVDKELWATTIPWGDVATAFYSTGIPDIEIYLATPPARIRQMRWIHSLRWFFSLSAVQSGLKWAIGHFAESDSASDRAQAVTNIWGEVSNAEGARVEMRLRTPHAYTLTAHTAVAAVERVLKQQLLPGPYTPSGAFGPEFVLEFENVVLNPHASPAEP